MYHLQLNDNNDNFVLPKSVGRPETKTNNECIGGSTYEEEIRNLFSNYFTV